MNYNDENVFQASKEDLLDKIHTGFVKIRIYYGIDDDDNIMIDMESMMDEFQRTVSGIGIVTDFIQGTDYH
jgi:hypothetical protein